MKIVKTWQTANLAACKHILQTHAALFTILDKPSRWQALDLPALCTAAHIRFVELQQRFVVLIVEVSVHKTKSQMLRHCCMSHLHELAHV